MRNSIITLLLCCSVFTFTAASYAEEPKAKKSSVITIQVNGKDGVQTIRFVKCPRGMFGEEEVSDFYIMETEMTIGQYKALCEEAAKNKIKMRSLDDLDLKWTEIKDGKGEKKEKHNAFYNKPTKSAPNNDEPVRFLGKEDIINIVNFFNNRNAEKKADDDWRSKIQTQDFNIPTEQQWRYAATTGSENDVCNRNDSFGKICNCIEEDITNGIEDENLKKEAKKFVKDKIENFILDIIKQDLKNAAKKNVLLTQTEAGKEKPVYVNIKTEDDKGLVKDDDEYSTRLENVLNVLASRITMDSLKLSPANPLSQFFSFNYEEFFQKELDNHVKEIEAENKKIEEENKSAGGSPKPLKPTVLQRSDRKANYKISFAGINNSVKESLQKNLAWDWRQRLKIRLYIMEKNLTWWDADEKNEAEKEALTNASEALHNLKIDNNKASVSALVDSVSAFQAQIKKMNEESESDKKALSDSLKNLLNQAKALNDAAIPSLKQAVNVFQTQVTALEDGNTKKALANALSTLKTQTAKLESNQKSIDENISAKKDLADSLNALQNQLETLKTAILSLSEIQTHVETMNNESLLSFFSINIGKRENKSSEIIYQALVYNLIFESKKIQLNIPPKDKKFHNVKFFRQNSSGIYGMFSNVAEWVNKGTTEKPEFEAIGINQYTVEKSSYDVLLFSLLEPPKESYKKAITKINNPENPIGVRLVLITTMNQDDFYHTFLDALFKEDSDIRDNSQVITDAIALQSQYEYDPNPKAAINRLKVKSLDLKDDSHKNDPFYNLINSKH